MNPSSPSGVSRQAFNCGYCHRRVFEAGGTVYDYGGGMAHTCLHMMDVAPVPASPSSETATEAFDTAALRRRAAELDGIDWPGGANGVALIEDAADEIDRLRAARAALGVQTAPVAWAVFNKRGEVETVRRDGVSRPAAYMGRETADVTAHLLDDCHVEALFRTPLPSPEQIRTTSEPTAPNLALARDAWREFASHVAGCVTCGQTSYADCFDGTQLHEAAKAADEGLLTVEPTPSFASSSPVPAEAPSEDTADDTYPHDVEIAALKAAAHAVCEFCRDGKPRADSPSDPTATFRYAAGSHYGWVCNAAPIWTLIEDAERAARSTPTEATNG